MYNHSGILFILLVVPVAGIPGAERPLLLQIELSQGSKYPAVFIMKDFPGSKINKWSE
jgi:hypothetical protein